MPEDYKEGTSSHRAVRNESGSFPPDFMLAERFRIIRWIASGGMGEVYEAHDCELDKRVAVKTVRQEIAGDKANMERFRREIALAHKVTHPGVSRIFDLFYHIQDEGAASDESSTSWKLREDTVAFLTMELLVGETLDERLKNSSPMPLDEALAIVRQVLEALAAAHEVGVIHRDLKCSNVMLTEGARGTRAVITDFGLARDFLGGAGNKVTVTGEFVGSPSYMAPEQAEDEEITPATDIYALGVILFRMVTGRLPFEGASPMIVLVNRLQKDAPPAKQFAPGLDARWDSTISKCLARQPGDRFASPLDVLRSLESEPPSANAWPRTILPALALGVVGVLGLTYFERSPPGQQHALVTKAASAPRHSVAVLGFRNLSGDSGTDWMATTLAELLTSELSVSRHLRTIPGENVARMKRDLDLPIVDSLASDTLQDVGQYLNSEFVVLGSYYVTDEAVDNRLRLNLKVQSTKTDEPMMAWSETATEAELLDLVTNLGGGLRAALVSDPAVIDTERRSLMPSDPLAARLYTAGLAELHSFNIIRARDLLVEAVAADPEYPLTHSALAEAYSTLGYDAKALEQISLAFERSEELPQEERLLVEGKYRELTEQWDQAIENYQTLFEFFPDNLEYGLELMRVQTEAGYPDGAAETLEALRRLPAPANEDPRIDFQESISAYASGHFKRSLTAAIRCGEKSQQIGARQLAARATVQQGRAREKLGELDDVEMALREAESVLFELGDRGGAAEALNVVGNVLTRRGEVEAGLVAYQEASEIFREIGDRKGTGTTINNQAYIHWERGNFRAADLLLRESLQIAREIDNKGKIVIYLFNLSGLHQLLGDTQEALKLGEEGLRIARQIKNPGWIADHLVSLASLKGLAEQRDLYQEALTLFRQLEDMTDTAHVLVQLGNLDLLEDDLISARRRYEEADSIEANLEPGDKSFDSRHRLTFDSSHGFARLAFEEGQFEKAATLAAQTVQQIGDQQATNSKVRCQLIVARSRLALGEVAMARQIIEETRPLAESASNVDLGLLVAIAEAKIRSAEGRNGEALALLKSMMSQSERFGLEALFEARLAAAELELAVGPEEGEGSVDAIHERLGELEKEARAEGYLMIARKARQAATG